MKKSLVLLIFISIFSINIFAAGGSVYSRYRIGEFRYAYSARTFALGGSGLSLYNRDYISELNPASWNTLALVRLEMGVNFRSYDATDGNTSAFYSETDFSGFTMGFPISTKYGIALVGGLVPYSNVQYDVVRKQNSADFGDYEENFYGKGGLSKTFFGLTYRLPFDLAVGASYEYVNGKIDYNSKLSFASNSDFRNSEYKTSLKSHGIGYTLGLISPDFAKNLGIEKLSELRVGITYNQIEELESDSVITTTTQAGTHEIKNNMYKTKIPSRIGAGLSFKWDENYTFMFDYLYQPMSQYEVKGQKRDYLRDSQRISVGFEYRHNSGMYSSVWEQIRLRLGISYEETQYKIKGQGINEYAAYAGFSFPIGAFNSIDLGVKYGIRGTTDFNLIKENLFDFYFSLSFGDLWFNGNQR